jgi:hypothetical protein
LSSQPPTTALTRQRAPGTGSCRNMRASLAGCNVLCICKFEQTDSPGLSAQTDRAGPLASAVFECRLLDSDNTYSRTHTLHAYKYYFSLNLRTSLMQVRPAYRNRSQNASNHPRFLGPLLISPALWLGLTSHTCSSLTAASFLPTLPPHTHPFPTPFGVPPAPGAATLPSIRPPTHSAAIISWIRSPRTPS